MSDNIYTSPPPMTSSSNGGTDSMSSPNSAPSAKDKAAESLDVSKQAAGDVAQTASNKAADVAQEAQKQARDLVGEARSQLTEQAGAQQRSLVGNLRSLAQELQSMADGSTQDETSSGVATDLVTQAADRAHGAADWLDNHEPGDVLTEVRTYARQHPAGFLIGAAVAGVLVGRLTRGVVAAHQDTPDTDTAGHRAVDPAVGKPGTLATEPELSGSRYTPLPVDPATDGALVDVAGDGTPGAGYGQGIGATP